LNSIKPGVNYTDLHLQAIRNILEGLRENGFVVGEIEEMMNNNIGYLFMPHGLGHFLGLETHDVGGFPNGKERFKETNIKALRIGRVLEEGMFLTVEPGLYFNIPLLEMAFRDDRSKFLVKDRIMQFKDFGGIRIEDDVLVTSTGIENLTSRLPKTVEEIERIMEEGKQEYQ